MKLNTLERLTVYQLLPEVGSFLNLKLVREAKEMLSFTEEEHKELKFVNHNNGSLTWTQRPQDQDEVEFDFNDTVKGLIVAALKKLDEQEKLEGRHISIYEKFVE